MKKTVAIILCIIMIFSFCACKNDNQSTTASYTEKTNGDETTLTVPEVDETLNASENDSSKSGKAEVAAIAKKYFDVDLNNEDNFYYSDMNAYIQTSADEIEIEVDGESLQFGMSYNKVLAKGFSLVSSEYADEQMKGLVVVCDFKNTAGKVVGLGFNADENETLKDGVLRLVRCDGSDSQKYANVTVNHIGMDSSIEDIISVFGDSIHTLSVVYGKYLSIKYFSEARALCVEFVIDPETENIYEIRVTDNR